MANKNTSIYKIFWFISCCLWASHVAAVDVLGQGDVLNSSASLVSRNELFTLRFFNLSSNGDSNTNYSYLGIFYRNDFRIPAKPFWIANRDRLITDNSGALVIDETGKLIITFNGGKTLLELFSGQSNNKVTAILQDDGNFVLKSGEQILWQSFDFPTDSFLPGMKLGINYKTGQSRSLTSWLTDSIPAPGAFSLDWDRNERQLILRRRGVTFWSSGVLSENNKFENINLDGKPADHKFIEVSNEEGMYLTYEFVRNQYTPNDWINVTWLNLSYDGFMKDQSSNRGVLIPDLCDGNSISSGCKRWEGPKCRSRGENFGRQWCYFPGSVDSSVYWNASVSLSDCKDICWKNCTCVGIAATSLTPNGTGCQFWYGPLGQEPAPIVVSESLYYIIRPGPPIGSPIGSKLWIWILIAVAAALIVILWGIMVFLRRRRLRLQAVHLPMPKQPAFSSTGRRFLDDNLISDSTIQNQSRNNLTISVMDARLNPNGTGCTFWYGPLEEAWNGMSESLYYIIRPGPPGVHVLVQCPCPCPVSTIDKNLFKFHNCKALIFLLLITCVQSVSIKGGGTVFISLKAIYGKSTRVKDVLSYRATISTGKKEVINWLNPNGTGCTFWYGPLEEAWNGMSE
ncbi:hypothetical protein QYF36_015300 [Acer negundo]|nr:hypothetical protein QYF36_015300 [Acer negundo]